MRILLGAALGLEGMWTALWLARLVPVLGIYEGITLVVIGARGLVGALQMASGWMLVRGLPPATVFARGVLVGSAVLLTLELGARLGPSSLFPSLRWPVIGIYWVYALTAAWHLGRVRRDAPG